MELFIILVLTIIDLILFLIIVLGVENEELAAKFLLCASISYPLLVLFLLISYTHKPKAIDVYEGKTTLEITYKDKLPIDSTVVWKSK